MRWCIKQYLFKGPPYKGLSVGILTAKPTIKLLKVKIAYGLQQYLKNFDRKSSELR